MEEMTDDEIDAIDNMDEPELREALFSAHETMDTLNLRIEIMERDMQKYRERLGRRDARIAHYEHRLTAIANDNPCGAHHDAICKEALEYRVKEAA